MLLDPFEEQFEPPACVAELSDCQCRQVEMLCQKDKTLVGVRIDIADTAQGLGIVACGIDMVCPQTST